MDNSRIVCIETFSGAKEEIRKIGVEADSLPWLAPKAVFITVKIDNVSSFTGNILKQEMLGAGGDVAVNRGVANCSVDRSSVLIMGTLSQYRKLIYKLNMQAVSLQEIAKELSSIISAVETGKPECFECGKFHLPLGEKTYLMGILNVTPDSFSDGGNYTSIDEAVKRAKEMVSLGADIIDIGGESTRPGHENVDPFEEINRVVPVIERIKKELEVPISVDTSKAIVAQKALEAGACIVNDVWGFQRDENIAKVVSEHGAGAVLMHNSLSTEYSDLCGDIVCFLKKSIDIAQNAGIRRNSIMIDPGIGFGKTTEQNLEIMRKLKELSTLGYPVLIGTSRKSMIGKVLDLPVDDRVEGTAATVAMGIANGVDVVRVHDVGQMVRVARMTDAMVRI
jgi:dihydropteroate synthase